MKKMVLAIIALTFIPSLCFATNFANNKKPATANTTVNTGTTSVPEEKTTVVKTETPVLSEEQITEVQTQTQSLESLLEVKNPEVTVETNLVSEVKTPQAKIETKSVSETKTAEVKVEAKPVAEAKSISVKTQVKPAGKKAPPARTPAFKEEKSSTTSAKAEIRSFTGKIDSVALGDAPTGIPPIIVAVDDNGERIPFIVKAKTSISDNGKVIKLTEVKKDSKVLVEYTVKPVEGFIAQSIKLQ